MNDDRMDETAAAVLIAVHDCEAFYGSASLEDRASLVKACAGATDYFKSIMEGHLRKHGLPVDAGMVHSAVVFTCIAICRGHGLRELDRARMCDEMCDLGPVGWDDVVPCKLPFGHDGPHVTSHPASGADVLALYSKIGWRRSTNHRVVGEEMIGPLTIRYGRR